MRLAVITIGDEITTGSVVDTNSSWISDFLLGHGIETRLHVSVPDDVNQIARALKLAEKRSDIVIVSGGLGPTEDDLTTQAACRFLGRDAALDHEALKAIEARFKIIGRKMTDNNRKQAMIPEGSELLKNPIGTAPGYYFKKNKTLFMFVPGVPSECRRMLEHKALPIILEAKGDRKVFQSIVLKTFGLTESQLDEYVSELKLPRGVRVGFRAVFPEIQLKITASGNTRESVEKSLQKALAAARKKVGQYIYSEDGRPIEKILGDLLREKGKTLALAESCTGGLIAKLITDVPGSSDYFLAGYVTYSNPAKTDVLGVPEGLILDKGAVSSEVAKAMAEGALKRSGADMALAVTGIAGPTGGSEKKPVGTVHIAIADEQGTWEKMFFLLRAERARIRELAAYAALDLLIKRLAGMEME